MKIILIFLLSIFSLNCFAAEHMTIGGFELVTKLPDKLLNPVNAMIFTIILSAILTKRAKLQIIFR